MDLFAFLTFVFLFGDVIAAIDKESGIQKLLKLDLPPESFKEEFFDKQASLECGNSGSKVSETDMGLPLSPEDFEAGQELKEGDFAPTPGTDPLHRSGYFEGDIKDPRFIQGRNAIRDNHMKWPGAEIPYAVSRTFDNKERSIIARAMAEFHQNTCVRFVPRSTEVDYVFITRKEGCFSMIGRDSGQQLLSLGAGCLFVGITVHELMHAVGFWHEQSRADRDGFVNVLWDNVQPGQTHNFAKYTDGRLHHLGEAYDYDSVMHYGPYDFSRYRDRPTILPRRRGVYIGQRTGFSPGDVRKINKLYHCNDGARETCVDSDSQCRGWAELGECQKNPRWMLEHCRKSCNQCRMKTMQIGDLKTA